VYAIALQRVAEFLVPGHGDALTFKEAESLTPFANASGRLTIPLDLKGSTLQFSSSPAEPE
jgi:hypothetical protein